MEESILNDQGIENTPGNWHVNYYYYYYQHISFLGGKMNNKCAFDL